MEDEKRKLWGELEKALHEWGQDRPPKLVEEVARVVRVNWRRDRVRSFVAGGDVDGARAYVERVGERYQLLSPYLHCLQEVRDREAWEALMKKLQLWSYNVLGRMTFPSTAARYRRSVDLATDAAMEILGAHFPYDVDFDPWAYVLVRNISYRYMRSSQGGASVPPEELVNLEAYDGWLHNLVDERAEARIYAGEDKATREAIRKALSEAIDDLPPSDREVIELLYFEGLSFDEIAERTGKKANALYQYHFRALQKLHDALEDKLPPL